MRHFGRQSSDPKRPWTPVSGASLPAWHSAGAPNLAPMLAPTIRAFFWCRHSWLCVLALFMALVATKGLLTAQDKSAQDKPAPDNTGQDKPGISVDVKVVNLLATVRDKKGAIVTNLGQDDFKLEEDARPQTIAYFARETDLPLTLGLLVDTSLSQRRVLPEERGASQSFLDNMLREGQDQAFLIHFDREVELLQDLTTSHQKLESALKLLTIAQPENDSGNGGNGGGNGGGGNPDGGGYPAVAADIPAAAVEVIRAVAAAKEFAAARCFMTRFFWPRTK